VIVLLLGRPILCVFYYQLLPIVGPMFAFSELFPWKVPEIPARPYPLINTAGSPISAFGAVLLILKSLGEARSAHLAAVLNLLVGAFILLGPLRRSRWS
jgi:hypothetical protein